MPLINTTIYARTAQKVLPSWATIKKIILDFQAVICPQAVLKKYSINYSNSGFESDGDWFTTWVNFIHSKKERERVIDHNQADWISLPSDLLYTVSQKRKKKVLKHTFKKS